MVAAELLIALFNGIFKKSCCAGTQTVPPPMPNSPAGIPVSSPQSMVKRNRPAGFGNVEVTNSAAVRAKFETIVNNHVNHKEAEYAGQKGNYCRGQRQNCC